MSEELLNQIVTGAPNFTGFVLCILVLWKVIAKQQDYIILITEKWDNCEKTQDTHALLKGQKSDI